MSTKVNYIPLVRSELVITYIDYISEHEPTVRRFIKDSGLPENISELKGDNYLSREAVVSLFKILNTHLSFGKYLEMLITCSRINVVKVLKGRKYKGNLYDVLNEVCNDINYYSTDTEFRLDKQGKEIWFNRRRTSDEFIGTELITISTLISIVEVLTGQKLPLDVINLRTSNLLLFDNLFKENRVLLNRRKKYTGILLTPNLLELDVDFHDPLESNENNVLDLYSYRSSLKQLIAPYLNGRAPSLDDVSGYVNISNRTLQRRLRKEGFTYSDIIFELIDEETCSALIHTDESLSDISYRMGYSNVSHMIRAFKNRFNITPAKFREKYLKN